MIQQNMKFHVILVLVVCLIGPCYVTSFQDCRVDEECSVGWYCGGASGLCEYCSCCCPDQISKQEFNGKCQNDDMSLYQWCNQPNYESECPCPTVPATDSSHTSDESSTEIDNQKDHTTLNLNTTQNATLNATASALPDHIPPAESSNPWLQWTGIGIAITVGGIFIIICIIGIYRRKKKQGKYEQLSSVLAESTNDADVIRLLAQFCRNDDAVEDSHEAQPYGTDETLVLPKGTQFNDLEPPSENTNTDVDPDSGIDRSGRSSRCSEESIEESTEDDDEAVGGGTPNLPLRNEEALGANALSPWPLLEENTHDSENLKCTQTVSGMLENISLMDELVFLDVPLGGKCVVDYLAQEFTDIKTNHMLAVKHYSDLYDSATKKVFHIMKTKKPKLKCVEIVRFLQNPNLQRNDVILVIQKHHMECPACQVYYNKIENMSSSVSETQPASPELC